MKSHFDDLEIEYDFWCLDLWEWAMHLVRSPLLADDFTWDPEKLYKHDGDQYIRFYDEPWTADRWHDIQSELPAGGHFLGFILYADKTRLSPFGTQMGYPIMARLANLPVHIRNGNGHGGSYVVGWLPIIEGDEEQKGNRHFVDLKRVVWHDSFAKLMKVLADKQDGVHVECGDGITRVLFPGILILSADYEEQAVMALIRGFQGSFPCPVCLVPAGSQPHLTTQFPLRTQEDTQDTVRKARAAGMNKTMAEQILKEKGLRRVDNAFWAVPYSDPHKALTFDRMHNNSHGLGGKHLWPLLQGAIEKLGRVCMTQVDDRASVAPRWRNFNHFNKILHVHFTDAKKFEDIVKISLYITHDLFPSQTYHADYLLLRLIRHYLNIDMYAALDVQTESTITAGEREIELFESCLKEYITATKDDMDRKIWEFVKLHMLSHLFPDVRNKGVTKNANTQPSESKHRELKSAWRRTNFRDVTPQILHKLTQLDGLHLIQARINAEDDLETAVEFAKSKPTNFGKVEFGAARSDLKKPVFRDALTDHSDVASFKKLNEKVNEFCKANGEAYGLKRNIGEKTEFIQHYTPYTEYTFIKVHYPSEVNWKEETDYLRCSASFWGHPRYDSVIYNCGGEMQFGQLQMAFTVELGGEVIPLCLIRPYEIVSRQRRSTKDDELQLLRLKKLSLTRSEVIFARSIIRGVPVFPAFDKNVRYDEHIVFDVIDTDMFIRIRSFF
ncbi:hypothetical protein NP233_g12248 [Leucocoprinus birnbaumii]|uniref:Uncharacterized protein n=1 Tax=Leucocoprinus birnbaumii TaxID=56174 RepID=A0AAD5VF53_9AGAR|nr:hypothetical protein NP233_g12248 [Leucocoprinus birnbaumii]